MEVKFAGFWKEEITATARARSLSSSAASVGNKVAWKRYYAQVRGTMHGATAGAGAVVAHSTGTGAVTT